MPSRNYKELKRVVNDLRRHLLPRRFDEGGDYRDRVFTHVIAFRILCHAAIEEYIESSVVQIAVKASKHCENTRDISAPAAHLLSFAEAHFGPPPATYHPPQENQNRVWPEKVDIVSRVKKSATAFIGHVKSSNHGIREKDLMFMLISVGLSHAEIDPILVSELDAFGRVRGEFAHTSAQRHVRNSPNPQDELRLVERILDLLRVLDEQLGAVERRIPVVAGSEI